MAFVKGKSGNPSGRPCGSIRSVPTMLQRNGRRILRELLDKALAGDMKALEICADRLWPKLRPTNRVVELPFYESLGEQGREVVKAVMCGLIASDEASSLMSVITSQAKVLEVSELADRVTTLETVGSGTLEVTFAEKRSRTKLNF